MNMKHKLLIVSVLSGSLFLLGGCGYNKNNSLVVFNYGDYLDPSIIDSFEKETGIKILCSVCDFKCPAPSSDSQ